MDFNATEELRNKKTAIEGMIINEMPREEVKNNWALQIQSCSELLRECYNIGYDESVELAIYWINDVRQRTVKDFNSKEYGQPLFNTILAFTDSLN